MATIILFTFWYASSPFHVAESVFSSRSVVGMAWNGKISLRSCLCRIFSLYFSTFFSMSSSACDKVIAFLSFCLSAWRKSEGATEYQE
ncbi:hypothetical protein IWZ00DRAFT_518185 [Phyllosticta capitalensis]